MTTKKTSKSAGPSAAEYSAMVEGASSVIATLLGSGTGQSKCDCIREVIQGWTAAAMDASKGELNDKATAKAVHKGVELAVQAGRDSGWSEATLGKAISLNEGDDDNG